MTTWLNLRPHEWLATMKQHENQAFCAGAKPKIRFRPAPHRTSRINTLAERSVSWILSLAGVTFFIQNTMLFCMFIFRRSQTSKNPPAPTTKHRNLRKSRGAEIKRLSRIIVPVFGIRLFLEKASTKSFEPLGEYLITT